MNVAHTIQSFLDRCYNAGIKDPVAFILSKRIMVYDWLKGCFPGKILPTDIDGLVHVGGNFLLLEFKAEYVLRNCDIPDGQYNCFLNLCTTGRFTVFLIGVDENGDPSCIRIIKSNGKLQPLEESSKEDIKRRCKEWSAWCGNGRVGMVAQFPKNIT